MDKPKLKDFPKVEGRPPAEIEFTFSFTGSQLWASIHPAGRRDLYYFIGVINDPQNLMNAYEEWKKHGAP